MYSILQASQKPDVRSARHERSVSRRMAVGKYMNTRADGSDTDTDSGIYNDDVHDSRVTAMQQLEPWNDDCISVAALLSVHTSQRYTRRDGYMYVSSIELAEHMDSVWMSVESCIRATVNIVAGVGILQAIHISKISGPKAVYPHQRAWGCVPIALARRYSASEVTQNLQAYAKATHRDVRCLLQEALACQ